MTEAAWNHTGSVLAVAGSYQETCMVEFYSPLGQVSQQYGAVGFVDTSWSELVIIMFVPVGSTYCHSALDKGFNFISYTLKKLY